MRLRIAIALAIVLSAISIAPGISSAADIDDGHDHFHRALSTSIISAAVPGPSVPNSLASVTTGTCARPDVLIGGGTLVVGSISNRLHLNGSIPTNAIGSPDLTGDPPASWTASGATGNQNAAGASTTAFDMCLADGPKHLRVIAADATAPALANTWTRARSPVRGSLSRSAAAPERSQALLAD